MHDCEIKSPIKPLILAAALALLLSSAPTVTAADFGEPLSLEEQTEIRVILEQPESYAGKRVRVAGEVTGVCQLKGCWMDVADDEGNGLRVKVEDGVIVFPPTAEGQPAVVEGEVEILTLERDRYVAWMRHFAEDAGETFDEGSVTGEGPFEIVRLRGLGADIALSSSSL